MAQSMKIKQAKQEWKKAMMKDDKNFSPKAWASTSYRVAHPQRAIG